MKRPCKDGDEVAAFSDERRRLIWRAGERKAAKQRANRRERRQDREVRRHQTW